MVFFWKYNQDQQRFFAPDIRSSPPKEPGPQFSLILYPVVSPLVCLSGRLRFLINLKTRKINFHHSNGCRMFSGSVSNPADDAVNLRRHKSAGGGGWAGGEGTTLLLVYLFSSVFVFRLFVCLFFRKLTRPFSSVLSTLLVRVY